MKNYKLWILLFALPAVGFTNCSDFSDVTVPAVDTSKPIVGSRVYEPGETDGEILFGNVSYETHDPNGQWIFAPFGYDSGGVHMLSVGTYEDRRCCQNWNPDICAWITSLTQTFIDSESANVGDTVSNGRFDLLRFTPKTSSGGLTCDVHRFGYTFQAMDFAGYLSSGSGSITYTLPEPEPPSGGGGSGFCCLVGGTGSGGGCDEDANTPCSAVPDDCQPDFQVQGTWQCIDGKDKCVLPPEGAVGSYCNGAWTGEGGSSNPKANCGKAYGLSCEAGECYPGSICNLQSNTGTKCGLPLKNPTTGEYYCPIPQCWLVNEKANLCAEDWILPPRP